MEFKVMTIAGDVCGSLNLLDSIFGLEVRGDLLHRMVRYQLAKRRQGTHAVKNRSDIAKTGAKMSRQKGTGRARHSSAKVSQFRGGGRSFGPVSRDHSVGMPKKVRSLALKHALSSKASLGELLILGDLSSVEPKTSVLRKKLESLDLVDALVVGGRVLEEGFCRAVRNIPLIDFLPVQGINVYDILRRKKLVLTTDAVQNLEERLK